MRRQHIPERLVRAAKARRLIPFVGSGLSKQADPDLFPNWNELLDRMILHFIKVNLLKKAVAEELKGLLRARQHLLVAESLKSSLPKDAYLDFLTKQFECSPPQPSLAHTLLLQLQPCMIITTNYDRLIEHAFARLKSSALSVVNYDQPAQVRNRLIEDTVSDKTFLFKLHGGIDSPGDIVLSRSDYTRLRNHHNGYQLLLSSIFFHYTILFIGFSLSDPEITLHLTHIQEALRQERLPDYACVSKGSHSHTETVHYRTEYGVEILEYTSGHNHAGLVDFLRQLATSMKAS